MSYLCAALAALFAYCVLAQPVEARIETAPVMWSSR
jgi:hypothetical protein